MHVPIQERQRHVGRSASQQLQRYLGLRRVRVLCNRRVRESSSTESWSHISRQLCQRIPFGSSRV